MKLSEIKKLYNALKPLYAQLIKDTAKYKNTVAFCAQWGEEYSCNGDGIMFCGRATNDWITQSKDLDILMPDEFKDLSQPERIFNRSDQMKWLTQTKPYNPNRSAFWRVIRKTVTPKYGDDWYKHIVWSNLCKMSFDEGNPSDGLYYAELDACCKILEVELEIFNPKHIVLLTGYAWAIDFLTYLNKDVKPTPIASKSWDAYKVIVYQINGRYFFLSEHPQGKDEASHVKTLQTLIKRY